MKKTCEKCGGFGKTYENYPKPACVLTPAIIHRLNEESPKCSVCNGMGYIEAEEENSF